MDAGVSRRDKSRGVSEAEKGKVKKSGWDSEQMGKEEQQIAKRAAEGRR